MKNELLIIVLFCGICTINMSIFSFTSFANNTNQHVTILQTLDLNGFIAIESAKLARRINFESWPKSLVWRVAPKIDKSLLSKPELVTDEYVSFGLGPFKDKDWAVGIWNWRRKIKSNDPLPTELPADRVKNLLEHLPPEKQDDPNFVQAYLQEKLVRYRKSKMYLVEGEIQVTIAVTPSARSAQEHMIYRKSASSLPIESVASYFSDSVQVQGLGTIGFSSRGCTMFVRDNIAVNIDARGELASEGLPLAQKIDSFILQQTPLTYEGLLSLKPSLSIAENIDEEKVNNRRTISYCLTVPKGRDIVCLRASTAEGQHEDVKGNKIFLPVTKGPFKIKLIAITNNLLATSAERVITFNN